MDTLKKMDKKYLYIIGALFGGIILLIIIVALVRGCSGPSNDYGKVQNKLLAAGQTYFKSSKVGLPKEFESKEVSAKELAKSGYMKPMKDLLTDKTCNGKVTVYNHGGEMLYIPHLECDKYKTKHIVDVIKKDSLIDVPEDKYQSGLYTDSDGTLVFKGKNPNNYVSLNGILWRIIDIDSNDMIRVIKVSAEDAEVVWDHRFNSTTNSLGKNEYKYSFLKERLDASYNGYKASSKLHMAPHNACIAGRDKSNLAIDRNHDCSEVLPNQYVTVLSVSDKNRASLDEECNSIKSYSCVNFNYFSGLASTTWTLNKVNENNHEIIKVSGNDAKAVSANESYSYNIVITIRGDELYTSGDGSSSNPYLIGEKVKD